jgi:hypothetical protein
MPDFELIGWIDNLVPPATPLSIAGIRVGRPVYGHTLDDATVKRVAKAGGFPPFRPLNCAKPLQSAEEWQSNAKCSPRLS